MPRSGCPILPLSENYNKPSHSSHFFILDRFNSGILTAMENMFVVKMAITVTLCLMMELVEVLKQGLSSSVCIKSNEGNHSCIISSEKKVNNTGFFQLLEY
ncbi:hypothetical protein JZ751_026900 [Albula glossodonta]|uniref:Uncharacterized protein n=1 Tax=Albula glossodonta TaxID=121402 RepID=A0A8T2PD99_9TELE|nr:hypothetical protein JZ751_026900 [Albula glossodonta]